MSNLETQHHISHSAPDSASSAAEYGVRSLTGARPPATLVAPANSVTEELETTTAGHDITKEKTADTAPADPMQDPNRITGLERWAVHASDSQFNALAGAVGGFMSGVVTCPLDVIKTKLQAQGANQRVGQPRMYNGLIGTANVIWKHEGIRGMYRGLGPIIMGYLPTWAVWFTVYNKSKLWLGEYSDQQVVVNFGSSIIAGGSSTIATNPIWVIKTRLMSQSASHDGSQLSLHPRESNTPTVRPSMHSPWHYKSTFDAARKMYTTEGILSFYSGLTPALLGLTHVAVQFPAYEFLKTKFTGQGMGGAASDQNGKQSFLGTFAASVLSKILASSATYPHEVIRTRLQTQRKPIPGQEHLQGLGIASKNGGAEAKQLATSAPKYRGVISTFKTILKEEGWRAFYAGMGTNMMRAVPAATVTMLTYEYVMDNLKQARKQGKEKLARVAEVTAVKPEPLEKPERPEISSS
ncbi:mitochondrial carrier domain-containing protein [Sordaria brevicollis]|uniref:Mitochondrial carrier domain-containing protein n=1 Tax=Sordaria brevicollis TaxID=83679 RepID=A0AAE0P2E2_SORBR|nr:mitochondrial carrier domain-containing protein [Sordaria brevicollis]